MERKAQAYVEDILLAIEDALRYSNGLDEASYLAQPLVRDAVERKLITMGEALSQLAKISSGHASRIPDWRKIVAFRNILVHGYRILDHKEVFRIVRVELPVSRDAVAALLAELDQG